MTMKLDWMRGCATALVTPFQTDGAIDEDRLRVLVDLDLHAFGNIDEAQLRRAEQWQQPSDVDRIRLAAIIAQVVDGSSELVALSHAGYLLREDLLALCCLEVPQLGLEACHLIDC